jgi:hypothetical protein
MRWLKRVVLAGCLMAVLYACTELIRMQVVFMNRTHNSEWKDGWYMVNPYWNYWAEIAFASVGIIACLYVGYRLWPGEHRHGK